MTSSPTITGAAATPATATIPIAATTNVESGIRIATVRIQKYRCLKALEVDLDDVTVLIGENNAGKTSFISALAAALGDRGRTIEAEDVFVAPGETSPPDTRVVLIDILIVPTTGTEFNEKWTKNLGNNIEVAPDGERATIRTTREWSATKAGHEVTRKFLQEWPATLSDMPNATALKSVPSSVLDAISLYVVDARRDIRDDLRARASFWARMTEDLHIPQQTVIELEEQLEAINTRIMNESSVLKHVQDHLDEIVRTLAGNANSVRITPITRQLRDVQEGMDIHYATAGAQSFPIAKHGMGTRSLASILTFRAYMQWKQAHLGNDVLHPFLALEEPEAHLHPQAQRAIFRETLRIPGQRIISTHSPYVAGQAQIKQLRHFKRRGPEAVVKKLDAASAGLDGDAIRAIEQAVMETRGELLFARAIILFEGETEQFALPLLAEEYWGTNVNSYGFSLLGCSGKNYRPFLRMASAYDIPWFIFSDGEAHAVTAVTNALNDIGAGTPAGHPQVEILPNGHDFEGYLASQGYEPELAPVLDAVHGQTNFIASYKTNHHGKPGKGGVLRDYHGAGGNERALADALRDTKTRTAKQVARAITTSPTPSRRVPSAMRLFFDKVSDKLGLPKWSGAT
ncbi:MAG: AAA family ATPase [Candidatus Thermoplasmatota archaeon]